MKARSFVVVVACAVAATVVVNCGRSKECASDAECPEGAYCNPTMGFCFAREGANDGGKGDGGVDVGLTDAGLAVQEPICSPDGWCWMVPFPTGSWIARVHGSGPENVWMAPAFGDEYLRWDGQTVKAIPAPFDGEFGAVWTASPTDVWAVGALGRIAHWTGSTWTQVPSGTTSDLFGIFGTAPDSLWAVGAAGTVLRWNGAKWSTESTPTASTLLALNADQNGILRAVGDNGKILRRVNTGSWTEEPSPTTKRLFGACSTSDGKWWAAGDDGTFLMNASEGWTSAVNATVTLWNIACVGKDVWLGATGQLLRWNGMDFEVFSRGDEDRRLGLWFASPEDGWAVGSGGRIDRWNGLQWVSYSRNLLGNAQIKTIWASSASDLVLGLNANAAILRCGPLGTCFPAHSVDGGGMVTAIAGDGEDNIWYSAGNGVFHWNGDKWLHALSSNAWISDLAVVPYGDGGTDVWFTDGELKRCPNESACEAVDAGVSGYFRHLAAGGALVWAIGSDGEAVACQADGLGCERRDLPAGTFPNDIWVDPAGVPTVVGESGFIRRWESNGWSPQQVGTTARLSAVDGFGVTNVWACGDNGVLLGKGLENTWVPVQVPSAFSCNGLEIVSSTAGWMSGGGLLRLGP